MCALAWGGEEGGDGKTGGEKGQRGWGTRRQREGGQVKQEEKKDEKHHERMKHNTRGKGITPATQATWDLEGREL